MSSKTVTIHRARAETRKEPIAVVVPDGDAARFGDVAFLPAMTKRVPPIANLGPLTEEYSLRGDTADRWLTGGTEADVISEAGLDAGSILSAVRRFAGSREERIARQRTALG